MPPKKGEVFPKGLRKRPEVKARKDMEKKKKKKKKILLFRRNFAVLIKTSRHIPGSGGHKRKMYKVQLETERGDEFIGPLHFSPYYGEC